MLNVETRLSLMDVFPDNHSTDPQRVSASRGSSQTHTQLLSPRRLRTFGFIRLLSLQLHDRIHLPALDKENGIKQTGFSHHTRRQTAVAQNMKH